MIVNHALYRGPRGPRKTGDGAGVLPEHDAVVFDEAHRLEESAAAWLGGRVSLGSLRRLLRDVERACRRGALRAGARARGRRPARRGAALGLDPGRGRRRLTAADAEAASAPAAATAAALVQLAEALRGGSDDLDQLARRSLALRGRPRRLPRRRGRGRGLLGRAGRPRLGADRRVGDARDLLWDREAVCVLVSATLEPRFLRTRLGLDDAREISLPSPYDFRSRRFSTSRAPFPSRARPATTRARRGGARALPRLGRAGARPHDVVQPARRAGRAGPPRLSYPVLVQGEAPRERLLERFRDEVDSVLIATQTFWQGVDVQVALAARHRQAALRRSERPARRGTLRANRQSRRRLVRRVRDSVGRPPAAAGIRPPDPGHADGVVAILDPRLRTRATGAASSRRFRPRRSSGSGGVAVPGCEGARDRLIPFQPRGQEGSSSHTAQATRPGAQGLQGRSNPRRTQLIFIGLAVVIVIAAAAVGIGFVMAGGQSSGTGLSAAATARSRRSRGRGGTSTSSADYEYNSVPATSGVHSRRRRSGTSTTSPSPDPLRPQPRARGRRRSVRQRGSAGDRRPDPRLVPGGPRGLIVAPLVPELEKDPTLANKIVLVSWTHMMRCSTFDEEAFTTFSEDYRGDAPEAEFSSSTRYSRAS